MNLEQALKMAEQAVAKVKYKKDSKFWRNWAKFANFFGAKEVNRYVTTTMGKTIWLSDDFDLYDELEKADTIVHELEHVKQYQKMTIPGFLFIYILIFLPIGLAYGRYWLERAAYVKGYKVSLEGLDPATKASVIDKMCNEFADLMAGGSYGYAWPFKKSATKWMRANLI